MRCVVTRSGFRVPGSGFPGSEVPSSEFGSDSEFPVRGSGPDLERRTWNPGTWNAGTWNPERGTRNPSDLLSRCRLLDLGRGSLRSEQHRKRQPAHWQQHEKIGQVLAVAAIRAVRFRRPVERLAVR